MKAPKRKLKSKVIDFDLEIQTWAICLKLMEISPLAPSSFNKAVSRSLGTFDEINVPAFAFDYSRVKFLYNDAFRKMISNCKKMRERFCYHSDMLLNNYFLNRYIYFTSTVFKILTHRPSEERGPARFKLSFPITDKNGKERWLLQRSFIKDFDNEGGPQLEIAYFSDITNIKWNYKMQCSLTYNNKEVIIDDTGILKCSNICTKREIQILSMIEKGLSSEKIAKKLFISKFTVDNHRKNIIARHGSIISAIAILSKEGLL